MNDLLFEVRCAKCGKVEYTFKNTPYVKNWEFINSRLVCPKCAETYFKKS